MKCMNCGKTNSDVAKFCGNCGKELGTSKITCQKCGTENEQNTNFCFQCGYNLKPKKKKSRVFIVLIVIIAIVAAGIGIVSYQQNKLLKQKEIESYKVKAAEVYVAINESEPNFRSMGIKLNDLIKTEDDLNESNNLVQYAYSLCHDEQAEEKSRKRDTDRLYLKFNGINCTEKESLDLKKVIDKLYSAYCDRYNLLVQLEFSTNTFSTFESDNSKVFDVALKKAKTVMDELEINIETTKAK